MAEIKLENENFVVPPGELRVSILSRDKRIPDDPCITAVKPAYLTTCFDEVTRNFVSLSVGSSLPAEVELVKCPVDKYRNTEHFPEIDIPISIEEEPTANISNYQGHFNRGIPILQHFEEPSAPWPSVLRTIPPDTTHLLDRYPSTDYNVFLRFDSWQAPDSLGAQEPFEPLFASMAYYHVKDKRATRISESFRVDLTTPTLRSKFKEAYFAFTDPARTHRSEYDTISSDRPEIDPVTKLTMSVCAIPEQLKKSELFLVVQVYKILSGDYSSAIAPYLRPSYGASSFNAKEKERFEEACKRLKFYRQQIGFGAIPLFDELKRISPHVKQIPIYCTRQSLNDDHIGEFITDLFPTEGPPRGREISQIVIVCTMVNLGIEKQLYHKLSYTFGRSDFSIVPAQFWSASMDADLSSWEGFNLDGVDPAALIRRLEYLPLPPQLQMPTTLASSSGSNGKPAVVVDSSPINLRRHLRTGLDHILFVYPMQYDKFQYRNLSCCIRLLEFNSKLATRFPAKKDRDASFALCHVYNNQTGGPLFCSKLLTTVWHHEFTPSSTDEIKIRLPSILTDRHWLEFEIRHVHIKLKANTGVTGFFSAKKGDSDDNKPEIIGVGYLQLLPLGLTMLHEGKHAVVVRKPGDVPGPDDREPLVHTAQAKKRNEEADAKLPSLIVGTRCLTSLKSTDSVVQKALSWGPIPLGCLPSSIMVARQRELTVPFAPSEYRAANVLRDLQAASVIRDQQNNNTLVESTNHFLVLMRHLFRGMCGGNGLYHPVYTSPYEHAQVRCQSFLTLLQLFGRLVPDVKFRLEGAEHSDMEVLIAYIEHLFDEEVPNRGQSVRVSCANIKIAMDSLLMRDDSAAVGGDDAAVQRGLSGAEDADFEEGAQRTEYDNAEAPEILDANDRKSSKVSIVEPVKLTRTVTATTDDMYFDYVALHCLLQAERIISEDILEHIVCDLIANDNISLSFARDSDHSAEGLRWWSEEIYQPVSNVNRSRGLAVSASNIITKSYSQMPFQPEESWFRSGSIDTVDNMCRKSSSHARDSIEISSFAIKHSVLEGYSTRKEKIFSAASSAAEDVGRVTESMPGVDLSHLSHMSTMMGRPSPVSSMGSNADARSRLGSDSSARGKTPNNWELDTKIAISLSGTPTHIQWWPWAYEVVTYQWLSLLCTYQRIPIPDIQSAALGGSPSLGYPFNNDNLPKDPTRRWFDTRQLALDHGPTLFRIIYKSLGMRIFREKKRGLIVLDADYMAALCSLLEVVSIEVLLPSSDLIGARNLIAAMSQFCMTLFGIIVPAQVASLINGVIGTFANYKQVVQVELRLLCIEYFSYFDQYVAVNAVLPLDCSSVLFRNCEYLRNQPIELIYKHANKTALNVNDALVDPHPHWLAELIIYECMIAYRFQDHVNSKDVSLRILLDLVSRQSFDARYQSAAHRQRIAVMYIPLFGEILKETENLIKCSPKSAERQGLLTLLLYILQDLPKNLLRELLRTFCDNSFPSDAEDDYGEITVATSLNEQGLQSPASPVFAYHAKPNGQKPTNRTSKNAQLNLWQLLNLLHLILDTFDVKKAPSASSHGHSPSVGSGSIDNGVSSPTENAVKVNAVDKLEQAQLDRMNKLRGSARQASKSSSDGDRMRHYRDRRSSKLIRGAVGDSQDSPVVRNISAAASSIVANTILLVIEECPHRLLYGIHSRSDRRINNSSLIAANAKALDANTMSKLLESSMAVILHAFHCLQSESVLIELLNVATFSVNRFGARLFINIVGDSLQDWARCVLRYCSLRAESVNRAACNFLITLFKACFYYFGSLHVVSDVFLAVFDDAIEDLLKPRQEHKRTYDDDDDLIQPLVDSLHYLEVYFQRQADESKMSSVTDTKNLVPFTKACVTFIEGMHLLIRADSQRRRHVSHQVGYDWHGVNMLDGPFDNLTVSAHQVQIMRMNRNNLSENPHSKRQKLETEEVMELFYKAAAVYDAIRLPRQHIRWLESLARLADLKTYRAEAGIVRWIIFNECMKVKNTWPSAWAPRRPLQWFRGVQQPNESNRNFIAVLYETCAVAGAHWNSMDQYCKHLETTLEVSIQRFSNAQLLFLAQRSFDALMTIQRASDRVEEMSNEYLKMATLYKTVSECGTLAYAMGTFYWVQYVGRGVPAHLRREFIYRNPSNLHVSEFHALIIKIIKDIVPKDTTVRISSASTPSEDDLNSNDIIIFMTSVKPIFRPLHESPIASNQVKEFQHFVPFTQNSKKAHAKTMDQQWKRSIIFSVPQYFPYVSIRQTVYSKIVQDMTPIEVSIDDIRDRILAMTDELANERVGDTNNLMRLIQGTVLPQVNAGAGEVARVFLPRLDGSPDTRTPEAASSNPVLVQKLKVILVEFLDLSKSLLSKSRRVLLASISPEPAGPGGSPSKEEEEDEGASNSNIIVAPRKDSTTFGRPENTNVIWQSEMERGYDNLFESIYPHINDIVGAKNLQRAAH